MKAAGFACARFNFFLKPQRGSGAVFFIICAFESIDYADPLLCLLVGIARAVPLVAPLLLDAGKSYHQYHELVQDRM